jgi:hypothetical protein
MSPNTFRSKFFRNDDECIGFSHPLWVRAGESVPIAISRAMKMIVVFILALGSKSEGLTTALLVMVSASLGHLDTFMRRADMVMALMLMGLSGIGYQ